MKYAAGTITAVALSIFTTGALGQGNQNITKRGTQETIDVGARLGAVAVDTLGDPIIGYGAVADYPLAPNLRVGGTIDYWNHSSGTLGNRSVSVSDFAVGANSKLLFSQLETPVVPYASLGLAVHRFAIRVSERDETDDAIIDRYEDSYADVEGEFGFDIGGGVKYPLDRNVDVIGDLRWRGLTDPGVDLEQIALTGGVDYVM